MSAAPEVFVSFVQLPEFVHRNGAERELRICASGCPGTETACAWLDWACVRAVAVEWGIDVLSTAGQQPPARLREVALASSALDNFAFVPTHAAPRRLRLGARCLARTGHGTTRPGDDGGVNISFF